MVYRRTSRISITFCSLLGQAFSRGTAQQLPISKCVWPVPTPATPPRAASAAAPQGWRSPTRAHANPAAAKCKPHAHHSAKQENTDFQRARKLGQCHELVHHLL
eukprot:scaffold67408_cov62-Phaeocystis_antarctica.AAC.1